jgi:hypothetical protein
VIAAFGGLKAQRRSDSYLGTTSARHSPSVPQAACPTCRVESMEAQLQQLEERGRDRAVALRAILRDDKQMGQLLAQHGDGQLALRVGHVLSCRHRRLAGWLAGWLDGWSGRVPGWLAGFTVFSLPPARHCCREMSSRSRGTATETGVAV